MNRNSSTRFPGRLYAFLGDLQPSALHGLLEEAVRLYGGRTEVLWSLTRERTDQITPSEILDACMLDWAHWTAVVREGWPRVDIPQWELCASTHGSPSLFLYVFMPVRAGSELFARHGVPLTDGRLESPTWGGNIAP